jgi:hypothetical protein
MKETSIGLASHYLNYFGRFDPSSVETIEPIFARFVKTIGKHSNANLKISARSLHYFRDIIQLQNYISIAKDGVK